MTQNELIALCAQWQETLRLQDWRIYLTVARAFDFASPDAAGYIEMHPTLKEAKIQILDIADWPTNMHKPQDQEKTLVHELLHIHFEAFSADEVNKTALEQGIELTAQALVNLKRKATNEPQSNQS